MFLYIVDSGLQPGDTSFASRTFNFLKVCKRWNQIAINFPRLWRWWVANAVKAWPLFHSRSKDVPISLTWRYRIQFPADFFLRNPGISERIHQLDIICTSLILQIALGAFDPGFPSNVSSLRLWVASNDNREPQGLLARFISSPFPNLSQLDLSGFLPDTLSPIFTTSSLTSLKLSADMHMENHYTLPQFSRVLQQHPNLQELHLDFAAIPLPGPPNTSVPFTLPRLVTLRLFGFWSAISDFIDLIGLSSPLHDVVIHFCRDPTSTVPSLTETAKKIIVGYYECRGLNYPRKVNCFTISYNLDGEQDDLILKARSHSAPTPNPSSNLELQFDGMSEHGGEVIVKKAFPLFPLGDVREFVGKGPPIYARQHNLQMFREMIHLSHLRLERQNIFPALLALSPGNLDSFKTATKTLSIYLRTHS